MITIKGIREEDFTNYFKPSMYIAFPKCTFKCEKECGFECCQNTTLVKSKDLCIDEKLIVSRYINNPISKAIVIAGLEPFDSWNDLINLIGEFRKVVKDMIVIYTGYNRNEIENNIKILQSYKNIIVKYGRYIPNRLEHYDGTIGVNLASDNQYAERIS